MLSRFESFGAPTPRALPREEEECEFTRALRALMQDGPAAADCALQGSVAMPTPREPQPCDTLIADADEAQLSADLLASALPHGYAQVRDRVASPYDADVLDFFRQLLHLEEQYANGLHALAERFQQPADTAASAQYIASPLRMFGSAPARGNKTASLRYATTQRAWTALEDLVRAQGGAHRACADELRLVVVGRLKASVKQADHERAQLLAGGDKAFGQVERARLAADADAQRLAKVAARFHKVHAVRGGRADTRAIERALNSQETALLQEAARACASSVESANALTRAFEGKGERSAINKMQSLEERRLGVVEVAIGQFARLARSSRALLPAPVDALEEAADGICVATDLASFGATYADACARPADELVAPALVAPISSSSSRAAVAAEESFWNALWKPLKALADGVLRDASTASPTPMRPAGGAPFAGAAGGDGPVTSTSGGLVTSALAAAMSPFSSPAGVNATAEPPRSDGFESNLLEGVNQVVESMGGAGLTMREAAMLTEQVRARCRGRGGRPCSSAHHPPRLFPLLRCSPRTPSSTSTSQCRQQRWAPTTAAGTTSATTRRPSGRSGGPSCSAAPPRPSCVPTRGSTTHGSTVGCPPTPSPTSCPPPNRRRPRRRPRRRSRRRPRPSRRPSRRARRSRSCPSRCT